MTKGIFIPAQGEQLESLIKQLSEYDIAFSEVGDSNSTVKSLPRQANGVLSSVFIANGNTYTVLSPEQGIGIERWAMLSKFLIPFWYGHRSFEEIQNYWYKAIGECYRATTLAGVQHLFMSKAKSFIDSLTDISQERYDLSMYIATLFIVREEEDLRYYKLDEAERKIEDWKAENYDPKDFFSIASGLSSNFRKEYEAKVSVLENEVQAIQRLVNTRSTGTPEK